MTPEEARAKGRAYRAGYLQRAPWPVDTTMDARLTYNGMDAPECLNIGSGVNPLPGAVNVDLQAFEGVDLTFDFTQPWPIADTSYDKVTMFHSLEHAPPLVAFQMLKEAHRVLRGMGVIIIEVPDIVGMCQAVVDGDFGMLIGGIYGGYDQPQDGHFFGYTKSSLAMMCHLAGFLRLVTKPGTDYHAVQIPTIRCEAVKVPTRDTLLQQP